MIKFKRILVVLFLLTSSLFAQFGQNRVQHKVYDWFYIQTKHFDIYFVNSTQKITEFTASVAEEFIEELQDKLDYKINNRIPLIVYGSHNEFQETNTSDSYISQGVGGFTEPFKNRVVFPFEGDYAKFRHVIRHELVHAVMRDYLYGGTVQNIISRGITLNLPIWYHEGMAEYLSSGWETNTDMFIRDAIINEYLPDINRLGGYFAYRGGQALFKFIADTYGEKKISEILAKTQGLGNLESGIKASIGLSLEELNTNWKKYLKKKYFPGIENRKDPDEFAKRLTNNKKSGGFYNTSPAISPQGNKIAFISDRDIYFDVYVMNSFDGKNVEKLIQTGRTNDFEELNILTPALTWAPDNERIALSVKSDGYDRIRVIDSEGESYELPFKMDGISSVSWSPDGKYIAFVGHNSVQSDIYLYNFETNEVDNLTNDIFTDTDPSWSSDSKTVFFSSDRGDYFGDKNVSPDFEIIKHNYMQRDIYSIEKDSRIVKRFTNWSLSNEKFPIVSPDGKYLLFVSDKNGIDNIYKKELDSNGNSNDFSMSKSVPLTNSLNGIGQLSISKDGKKLIFTSLFNSGYNIFRIDNPFDNIDDEINLENTKYMEWLISQDSIKKSAPKSIKITRNNKSKFSGYVFTKEKKEVISETVKEEKTGKDSLKNFTDGGIFIGQVVQETKKDTGTAKYSKYKFINENESDTIDIAQKRKELFREKLDEEGNFLVNRYKINFSPDIIYANAGYSTFYGLLGTTVLSFSDVLGNHRLIGVTSMQVDLKNSDYGLSYYYLAKKIDYGIEGFHTARFVYINTRKGDSDLYRFRTYGLVTSASIPFSRFYRMDASLSMLNTSSENLDDLSFPLERVTFFIPSLSFVHDNTLWGYYSPIEGSRFRISVLGNPGIKDAKRSFYALAWDFRKYMRFWFDNSFVVRFSGGYSGGANPQRFMLGGVENWINRTFATGEVPFEDASDFVFLSPAMPMRGFDYAEQLGTKYSLLNIELRMPVIRYLLTGPLPLFFQNILGNVFLDVGSAWTDNSKLKLFEKNDKGEVVTKDLLIGTGTGLRGYFLFFLARLDIAWSFDGQSFSKPRYYFSLGLDF